MLLENFPEVGIVEDAFARFCNWKADIFFSRLDEPGSSRINFLSQRLFPSLGYYCFPPPGVILATIIHLAWFKVSGLLVILAWPSGEVRIYCFAKL